MNNQILNIFLGFGNFMVVFLAMLVIAGIFFILIGLYLGFLDSFFESKNKKTKIKSLTLIIIILLLIMLLVYVSAKILRPYIL